MLGKVKPIGLMASILTLLLSMIPAHACQDVEDIFDVPENPAISTPLYRIDSYTVSEPVCGNFNILSGPIRIYEQLVCQDCCMNHGTSEDVFTYVQVPTESYAGCVRQITIGLTLSNMQWYFEYWQCLENFYLAETGASFWTPADNPHPILEYLEKRYPFDGACIAPFEHEDGPPPDEGELPDQSLNGRSPQKDKPVEDPGEKGEPISIYNGNNIHAATDLSLNSPFENGFKFKRFYNSRFKTEDIEKLPPALGSFGHGWTNTYNAGLGTQGWYSIPAL